MTMTAKHKQGESGLSQNNVGLNLNYRFGVPLKQQLAADEVAVSRSLRGSRYDSPERDNLPVVEYRQRKSLSVYRRRRRGIYSRGDGATEAANS